MSLLEDLQSIDLSAIVDARGSISASISSPQLQSILQGGAAQSALASLGAGLGNIQGSIQSPADLLQPLSAAFGELSGSLEIGDLPIGDLQQAVEQGVEIIRVLVEGLDSNPTAVFKVFNLRTTGMAAQITDTLSTYTRVGMGEISAFRQLIELVERGFPSDPSAFATLAVDALVPFPSAALREMRVSVDGLMNGAAQIVLPETRTSGLLLALAAVERAALTGEVPALQSALAELERVRLHTIGAIQEDLRGYLAQVQGLRLGSIFSPIEEAGRALGFAQEGVLEFMSLLRLQVQAARAAVQQIDISDLGDLLTRLLDWAEQLAQTYIVDPIEAAVENLKAWLRSLLHEIPIFELRAELSDWLHGLAQTIRDADLDGPAEAVRGVIVDIRAMISPASLTAEIQAALGEIGQMLEDALGGVLDALAQIGTAIDSVAGEAQAILGRVAEALAQFKVLLDELAVAVETLGIEQAGQQVGDDIRKIRETAEELLSVQPLPDALRPLVEQLIEALESVDFEVVLEPVKAAVEEFRIPPEVNDTIIEGLQAAQNALEQLIPAELIASIDAEITNALDTIRGFDPASLLPDVSAYLDAAADFIESLDPSEHLDVLQGPFDALVGAFDLANPVKLLQPVIAAYDELMGGISLPTPDLGLNSFNQALASAGDGLAQAVAAPLQELAPANTPMNPPGGTPEAGGSTPIPVPPSLTETIRPGDLIRVFGYLPMKLREALQAMNASQAGDILQAIDSLTGGLARDLRSVQAKLWELEDRLALSLDAMMAPLAPAQLRAQAAIQANFQAGPLDLNLSLNVVAMAGPGVMRSELSESFLQTAGSVHTASRAASGSTGAALDRIADLLEGSSLARLVADLDGLLAALDPEPLAAELDAFVLEILGRAPELLAQVQVQLEAAIARATGLIADYNPLIQAQKFIRVLDVLREELERLSPRSLAFELGELHTALRESLMAYNPAAFAAEISGLITGTAAELRALTPADLLGDLSFLDGILAQVEAANPAEALQGVGTSLEAVGAELAALDPGAMLEVVSDLGPRLLEAFTVMLDGILTEIVALLKALKYSATSAEGSVSVSGTIG